MPPTPSDPHQEAVKAKAVRVLKQKKMQKKETENVCRWASFSPRHTHAHSPPPSQKKSASPRSLTACRRRFQVRDAARPACAADVQHGPGELREREPEEHDGHCGGDAGGKQGAEKTVQKREHRQD
ncbi:MAG: hypothetical protein BJ554DRAFT_2526, partial [Olpidium bornovanus]